MDAGDRDFMEKLLQDMETFLTSTIADVELSQAAEGGRNDLLKQIQYCQQQILTPPQEYVDMSGCTQSTDDDSFSGSESISDAPQDETGSIIEPVEYENQDVLFPVENKELPQADSEENLNLADANPPSASELKAMTVKCGPLQRKDRFMLMQQLRRFWVALYANRLYFYSSEKDTKPQNWISITGYTARPAPNAIRDSKKKPSCFEIICPGNKTLQLIARTPKDMEQWIVAINHVQDTSDLQRGPESTSISQEPSSGTYEDVDLVCPEYLQGLKNVEKGGPASGEDDAIYNDIDSAFNPHTSIIQDIYDDTDTTKKYDESIYDDVDTLRNVLRNNNKY